MKPSMRDTLTTAVHDLGKPEWRPMLRYVADDGFVALGDAVCAFNPVYGQGMIVAALGALTLDEHLRAAGGNQHGMVRRFQKRLAKVVATPWLMATGNDFRIPTTEGGSASRWARLTQRYIDKVGERAGSSPKVYRAFLEVSHLLAPPTVLFRPAVVGHVIAGRFMRLSSSTSRTDCPNTDPASF